MALLLPSPLKPMATLTTTTRHRLPPDLNSISPPPRPFLSSFPSFSAISSKPLIISSVCSSAFTDFSDITDFDAVSDDLDDDDALAASPWEGAVVYRRDASVTHLEYATTLERLGLAKLSTGLSRSRASAMGIRLPSRRTASGSSPGDGDEGTPVLVSVDVTRRKRRLKLDGIIRTVITLGCKRCAEPAAESVFSNFTLLLTEYPIEEAEEINMTIYGEDQENSSARSNNEEEEEDEKQIDIDDRLHFPSEGKEIDISKNIRDLVHVEITINAVCDASCKGLCLQCGANLNKSSCSCNKKDSQEEQYGPLKDLGKQMQKR